jgi:flagellar biosynthesis/type III secretory pathway chaperone
LAIQEIVDIMQEMTGLHQQLLELAVQKKDVIIHNQVDQLNGLVNKESKLVKRISELEQQRVFETDRYLVGKGYRPNPAITVSDLTRIIVKAGEKQALTQAQAQLLEVLEGLKAANKLNQELSKQSLAFIDYSLNLLVGAEDEAVYHNPQQQSTGYGKRSGFFDSRA